MPREPSSAAGWVLLQTLVDSSGWPAVLAMAGRPAFPAELAEREAVRLRNQYGARVLRAQGGRLWVRPAEPGVTAWAAELDERVTQTSAALERQLEASRYG